MSPGFLGSGAIQRGVTKKWLTKKWCNRSRIIPDACDCTTIGRNCFIPKAFRASFQIVNGYLSVSATGQVTWGYLFAVTSSTVIVEVPTTDPLPTQTSRCPMKKFTFACLLLLGSPLNGASAVDYVRDIQPLLSEKCAACHGALRQEAGLRLDHGQLLRQGADSGQIIDAQQVERSVLIERVTTADVSQRMPPEGEGEPLNDEQLSLLRSWVAQGAPSPTDEAIPAPPEEHWAWQPPLAAPLPQVADQDWARHPLDRFLAARQAALGLSPVELADPRTRLRRLYFDLVGLPPTPAEQAQFLSDPSPAAWDGIVDRLLEDPAHGQRWARHWMDVWRYSDWDGYKQELRSSQRHIWRWRDWIVESLNSDKGYDRMLVEMLAGDEIAPTDPDVLRATGFLARSYHKSNRDIWLDATVEHTAKAFMGLTISCARCHDHKYDPISQQEYYSFRAIFEPHNVRTERLPGEPDIIKDGLARAFDAAPDAPTYVYIAGNEKLPDREHPVAAGVPSIVPVAFEVAPVALPPQAIFPSLADFIQREDLAKAENRLAAAKQARQKLGESVTVAETQVADQKIVSAEAELESWLARCAADTARFASETTSPDTLARLRSAAVKAEQRAKLEAARLVLYQKEQAFAQALAQKESQATPLETEGSKAVSPNVQSPDVQSTVAEARKQLHAAQQAQTTAQEPPAGDAQYTSIGTAYPSTSTGRRSALARWLVDPRNPLTARVAVNHVWLHYFGQPLVENTFDFGLRSPTPDQQALLDWLAVELMEHNWSLKHVQRLIVTSRVYQLSSRADERQASVEQNLRVDPDNRAYWRAGVRRLDAEVIRDSLLAIGGNLDRSLGGPEIDYQLGETTPRRSLYLRHAYEKQMTMLVLFDAAGPQECYRRSESIIPQQALALSNSPLSFDQARRLAQQLWLQVGNNQAAPSTESTVDASLMEARQVAFIQAAFETLLCRACTPLELHACQTFLVNQADLLSDPSRLEKLPGEQTGQTQAATDPMLRAQENLIHALLNHNDFVTIR
jgi:hypothetical protein